MELKEKRTESLVGFFLLIGLIIVGGLIVKFGRFGDQLESKYRIHVAFDDATGIIKGSDVRLGGAKIGQVFGAPVLNENYDGVLVVLEIFNDIKVPKNSTFSIQSIGLLGDSYIQIKPPAKGTGKYIDPDATIMGIGSLGFGDLQGKVEDLSTKVLMTLTEIDDLVKDLRETVGNINTVFSKLDEQVLTKENTDNIKGTLTDLRSTAETLSQASKKITPMLEEATHTFKLTSEIVEEKFKPLLVELRSAATRIVDSVVKFTENEGLLNALIADEELKKEVKEFISNLRIHGILGYKNHSSSPSEEEESQKSSSFFRK